MILTTQTLIDELRLHLGEDEGDLPDNDAIILLNRSYGEIEEKYPFREKEITATFPSVASQRLYGVPAPFEALRQISILHPTSQAHKTLDVISIFQYENNYKEGVSYEKIPTHYTREGCNIRLWPTPDQAYTLTLKYWSPLTDVSLVQNPVMPPVWHEIILYGAIVRGFLRRKDFTSANQVKMMQKVSIDSIIPVEAKEEIDTPMAALQAMRPEYDV